MKHSETNNWVLGIQEEPKSKQDNDVSDLTDFYVNSSQSICKCVYKAKRD